MHLGALKLSFDAVRKVIFSDFTFDNKSYETVNDTSGLFPWQPVQHCNDSSAMEIEQCLLSQSSFCSNKGGGCVKITN